MKIFALELSTARGSIACLDGGAEIFVREFSNDRKHSGLFFENLQEVTHRFGPANLIVVGLGPGSYAGVRIAIAAATGLGAASGARLAGLPSICAIATEATEYCVIGDARRKSLFFARIRANKCVEGPDLHDELHLRNQLEKVAFETPVFTFEHLPFERAELRYPSALLLARIAERDGELQEATPLEPIYLREPNITVAKIPAPSTILR